jgi:Arc/MetJ-type ribon-helix-helix transcriptional regulator
MAVRNIRATYGISIKQHAIIEDLYKNGQIHSRSEFVRRAIDLLIRDLDNQDG